MPSMKENGITIGFVSLELHPTTPGGAGILIHHTIKNLLAKGYEIVLLLDIQDQEFKQFIEQDLFNLPNNHLVHAYQVNELCTTFTMNEESFLNGVFYRSARINHALEQVVKLHSMDLVEFYDYCGPAYYFLASTASQKTPIAIRLHNTIELIERRIRAPLDSNRIPQYAAERASLSLADVLLSSGTDFFKNEILTFYSKEASLKRVNISPPVHFSIGSIEYSLASSSIVFYGRLSTFKGLDTFIRAALLALDNINFETWLDEFIIIGPEETVATSLTLGEIKNFIPKKYAHKFRFTGRLTHQELMHELKTVAFACFANRIESFCYAAHELHTANIPIALSNTPAFRDHFIDKETAVFFEPAAISLSNTMQELATTPALRQKLSMSSKAHMADYLKDHYADHVKLIKYKTTRSLETKPLCLTVFVLSDGSEPLEVKTINSITKKDCTIVILRENLKRGKIFFSSSRWTSHNKKGAPLDIHLKPVTDAVLFIRAGDVVSKNWIGSALTTLKNHRKAGSIGCWLKKEELVFQPTFNLLPETGPIDEPGLRVMIRTRKNQVYSEFLHGYSSENEASYMLEHRSAGRVCLESPMVGVNISGAVKLKNREANTLTEVDFDRMSSAYMATRQTPTSISTITSPRLSRENAIQQSTTQDNPALTFIKTIPGTHGEFWILRLFHHDFGMPEPWSSVLATGQWEISSSSQDPAGGALKVYNGEIRLYVTKNTRIEVLYGPFCGQIEIFYRGKIHRIDLHQQEVSSNFILFGTNGEVRETNAHRQKLPENSRTVALLSPHIKELANKKMGTAIILWNQNDTEMAPYTVSYRSRTFLAHEITGQRTDNDPLVVAASLSNFCKTLKLKRLILSSKFPIEVLELFIDLTDNKNIELVIFLSGFPLSNKNSTPTANRFSHYSAIYRIVQKCNMQITIASTEPGILKLFSTVEISTLHIPPYLPTLTLPTKIKKSEQVRLIDLAVLPADSIENNIMHMVGATFLLPKLNIKIDKLYLPIEHEQAVNIASRFKVANQVQTYSSLTDLVNNDFIKPVVSLCVYPDEELPSAFNTSTSNGIPCIVGPCHAFADQPGLRNALSVPYWEDSSDIANAITRLFEKYNETTDIYNQYAEKSREMTSSFIEELVAIPQLTQTTNKSGVRRKVT